MALDGTYAGLLASAADFLKRTDLTSAIPDFVAIAEADLNRKLRVRLMTGISTATVNSQFATVPDDFAGAVSMWNSEGYPMRARSIDAIVKLTADNASGSGVVTDYAVLGDNFAFYPVPTTDQLTTMAYYKLLPALATYGTNWLLTNHPDAYLYGALTAAAPYLQDDERIPVWGSLYTNAVTSILNADMERYGEALTPQPSATQIV